MSVACRVPAGGGTTIAAVECSADGGATWHPAAGMEEWSWTGVATGVGEEGTVEVLSRAVDDLGYLEK